MEKYFNKSKKFSYYVKFFLNKFTIITECSVGRIQILIVEMLWILRNILKLDIYSSLLIFTDYFETSNGKFKIHKDLQSAITVSPTYEYDDIHTLIRLIGTYVQKNKKILFIDVGAHIGKYSVSVGSKFNSYSKLHIIAFEPDANNFSENNSDIFKKNIQINKIRNVKLYKIGLGNNNTNKKNKFGFMTKKLDSVCKKSYFSKYDVVFMKLDIEGFEEDALRGSVQSIQQMKECYFLIEDCVKNTIVAFMEQRFTFVNKITPYNSFWKK